MRSLPHSKNEALSAVPVPSPDIRLHITKQGLVRISYPMHLQPWLARLLSKKISLPMRTLELDSMGSFVWSHIDGKTSVQKLAELVGDHYQCLPSEAELAVATFIRQLGQRSILGLH
jgi:hypothetical protein